MTESEYLTSTDPAALLSFLEGKLSERRLRLFACGCSRQNWDLLTDERSRKAVETAERYADGLAGLAELAAARAEAHTATLQARDQPCQCIVADEAEVCAFEDTAYVAEYPTREKPGVPLPLQAALLRDIAGNPFRPWGKTRCSECEGSGQYELILVGSGIAPCPECDGKGWKDDWETELSLRDWLRWQDGTVLRLAQAIYEDRVFDRMPILADALEEADCDSEEILRHCRGQERCPKCKGDGRILLSNTPWPTWSCCRDVAVPNGPRGSGCDGTGWIALRGAHVRGCWLTDLLLGKE